MSQPWLHRTEFGQLLIEDAEMTQPRPNDHEATTLHTDERHNQEENAAQRHEQAPDTIRPWTLLLEPAAAQSAVQRISKLNLTRHICRPLDARHKHVDNSESVKFFAAF